MKPAADKYSLDIEWSSGKRCTVDLLDHISDFEALKPLRDLTLFSQVKVGERGLDVTWGNELEVSATTLYRFMMASKSTLS